MSARKLRVHQLRLSQLTDVLRGTCQLKLPHDAELVAVEPHHRAGGVDLYISSDTYPAVENGMRVPICAALIIRSSVERAA